MSNRRITNAEYMINLLMDILEHEDKPFERINIGDGGASEEAMVYYNVVCPYIAGDDRAGCHHLKDFYKATRDEKRRICGECKYKWLLQEVDE